METPHKTYHRVAWSSIRAAGAVDTVAKGSVINEAGTCEHVSHRFALMTAFGRSTKEQPEIESGKRRDDSRHSREACLHELRLLRLRSTMPSTPCLSRPSPCEQCAGTPASENMYTCKASSALVRFLGFQKEQMCATGHVHEKECPQRPERNRYAHVPPPRLPVSPSRQTGRRYGRWSGSPAPREGERRSAAANAGQRLPIARNGDNVQHIASGIKREDTPRLTTQRLRT